MRNQLIPEGYFWFFFTFHMSSLPVSIMGTTSLLGYIKESFMLIFNDTVWKEGRGISRGWFFSLNPAAVRLVATSPTSIKGHCLALDFSHANGCGNVTVLCRSHFSGTISQSSIKKKWMPLSKIVMLWGSWKLPSLRTPGIPCLWLWSLGVLPEGNCSKKEHPATRLDTFGEVAGLDLGEASYVPHMLLPNLGENNWGPTDGQSSRPNLL